MPNIIFIIFFVIVVVVLFVIVVVFLFVVVIVSRPRRFRRSLYQADRITPRLQTSPPIRREFRIVLNPLRSLPPLEREGKIRKAARDPFSLHPFPS